MRVRTIIGLVLPLLLGLGLLVWPPSLEDFEPLTRRTLVVEEIKHEGGFVYRFMLPEQALHPLSDVMFFEGEVPLSWVNNGAEVSELGLGRYTISSAEYEQGRVYFSATDNSDPRQNGRVYQVRYTYPVLTGRKLYFGLAAVLLAVFAVLLWALKPDLPGLAKGRFSPLLDVLLPLLLALPFAAFILRQYIGLDFWYDEILTLRKWVLAPLSFTVLDYSDPNNHVFSNLLFNLYLKLLGVKDLFALALKPWLVRSLPFALGLLSLGALYLIGKKYFNRFVGLCSLILLSTTLPFANYTVQIRGYMLSMTLTVLLLYWLFGLETAFSRRKAVFAWLCGMFLLYTLPTNLYLLGSIMLFYGLAAAFGLGKDWRWRKDGQPFSWRQLGSRVFENSAARILFVLGAACLGAFLLYLPLFDQIFYHQGTFQTEQVSLSAYIKLMKNIFTFFVSLRWLLIPAAAVGLAGWLLQALLDKGTPDNLIRLRRVGMLLLCMPLPFALSPFQKVVPPQRVFMVLLPLFVLLISLGLDYFKTHLLKYPRLATFAFGALILYAGFSFLLATAQRDAVLLVDRQDIRKRQDIFYNYYQAHYNPSETIADFKSTAYDGESPLYVYKAGDDISIPFYLDLHDISQQALTDLEADNFPPEGAFYVVTAFPRYYEELAEGMYPAVQCEQWQPESSSFTAVVVCQ